MTDKECDSELERDIDGVLGLVPLPTIRLSRETHTALVVSAKANGNNVQFEVRRRLDESVAQPAASGDPMPASQLRFILTALLAAGHVTAAQVEEAFEISKMFKHPS